MTRLVPLVAVAIAGLLGASAVGAVVVDDEDDDTVATDATTTSSFPPFEELTTTSSIEQSAATVVPDASTTLPSVAPVTTAATTTSTTAAPAGPVVVLATGPAPCQAPAGQPPPTDPLGTAGVFTVAAADGAAKLTNPIARQGAWRPKTGQVVTLSLASGKPPGLCLSGPDGGGMKAITTPAGAGRPALSADGGKVAVRSVRPGGNDLVVFSVEAADQKVIVSSPEIGDPVWLGNGSAVVTCAAVTGARRLISVPAGGGAARILRDACPASPVSSSPDGTRIAFAQGDQVTVLTVANRAAVNLKLGTSMSTASAPTWSPDGKRLAFAYTDGQGAALGQLDLTTNSGSTRFRTTGLTTPSWAPAGETIAFAAAEGDGQGVFTVKADGSDRRLVHACTAACTLAAQPWAGDASALVVETTGAAA